MTVNPIGSLAAISCAILLSPVSAEAHEISEQDCKDLGRTLELLAKQNLQVAEIRKGIAHLAMEALLENTVAAAERQTAIENAVDGLGNAAIDAKDLVPGIKAFRSICP